MTSREEKELNRKLAEWTGLEFDSRGACYFKGKRIQYRLFTRSLDVCFHPGYGIVRNIPGVKRVDFRINFPSKDVLTCEVWWDNTTKPEHREIPVVLEGRVLFSLPFPTEKDFALALCLAVDKMPKEEK